MVTGRHDDLDSGRLALGNRIRNGGSGWVHHGHDSDHSESGQREVDLVGVEAVSRRKLPDRKSGIAKSHEALAKGPELGAGIAEGFLVLLVDGPLLQVGTQLYTGRNTIRMIELGQVGTR